MPMFTAHYTISLTEGALLIFLLSWIEKLPAWLGI